MKRSNTYIAIPPGETIKELLSNRGVNQKEFAIRMDMSEKHISRLINGEVQLTSDTAYRLELVLGVPARFWNRLEAIYRENLAKVKAENEAESEITIARELPYKAMIENKWIEDSEDDTALVIELRKFFGVVRLSSIENSYINPLANQMDVKDEKIKFALISWAQQARRESAERTVSKVNRNKLKRQLNKVYEEAGNKQSLTDLLAGCGISLVFLDDLTGYNLKGVTFSEGKKIVIGLNKTMSDDEMRFSLFHEIGHIILGHLGESGNGYTEDEREADDFAEKLIADLKSA